MINGVFKIKVAKFVACCIVFVSLMFIYYKYNPTEHLVFPQCLFLKLTGWQCPSCGLQRMIYFLLHGEWRQAVSYNPFLLVSFLYLGGLILMKMMKGKYSEKLNLILLHPICVKLYILIFFSWWIIRNLN